MKKIFTLLMFLIAINFCFADGELAEYYHNRLVSNEDVESLESISPRGEGVLIRGLVYNRVRLDSIYVKSNYEGKDEVVMLISDLEAAFLKKNKDIRTIAITATEDSLVAKGEVDVLGGTFDVVLEGVFSINGNNVYYDIRKAKVGVFRVPQLIINNFKEKLNPFFKIDELDIGLKLTRMVFKDDKILIR